MQFLEEFRSLAARGEYIAALQSFEEFGDEIGEIEKDKKTCMIEGYSWKQIKNELQKEAHLVNEILNELRFFNEAVSFGPQHTDEPVDYFKSATVPQKSIQERYEMHSLSRKPLKNVCILYIVPILKSVHIFHDFWPLMIRTDFVLSTNVDTQLVAEMIGTTGMSGAIIINGGISSLRFVKTAGNDIM